MHYITVKCTIEKCNFKIQKYGNFKHNNIFSFIAASLTSLRSCGLVGTVSVNVSLPGGAMCAGTLSDWDPNSCSASDRLTLQLPNCRRGSFIQGRY